MFEILAYSASDAATNLFVYNNIISFGISFTINIGNVNGYILNNDIGSVASGSCTLAVSDFDYAKQYSVHPDFWYK